MIEVHKRSPGRTAFFDVFITSDRSKSDQSEVFPIEANMGASLVYALQKNLDGSILHTVSIVCDFRQSSDFLPQLLTLTVVLSTMTTRSTEQSGSVSVFIAQSEAQYKG